MVVSAAPLCFAVDAERMRRDVLRYILALADGCSLALNGGNSPTMEPRKFKQFDAHNNKPPTTAPEAGPSPGELNDMVSVGLGQWETERQKRINALDAAGEGKDGWRPADGYSNDEPVLEADGFDPAAVEEMMLGVHEQNEHGPAVEPNPLGTLPAHFLIVDINTMWLDGARSFLVRQWAANVHQLRWCEDCTAWTNYNSDLSCVLCHGTDNDETGCIRVGCVVDLWQLMNLQQREADKAAVLGFLTMTREAALENIDVAAHLQTTREDTPLDDGDDGLVTTDTDYTADIREALAMFERSIAAGWVWNDTAWDEVGAPYFALARYIATNPDESSPGEFMSLGDDDLSDTGSLGLDDGACLSALQLLLESRACALRSSRHRV
jgi:hypothetical protein